MKISIIIPIYNIEDYIVECVSSIIAQTYKNIEIILINDGSIDKSEKICKELKEKDNRIKYIYKNNGGLSSARNEGIRNATGEYLMFVDGDDFLKDLESIQTLVNNLRNKKSDIVIYKMIEFYQESNKYIMSKNSISKKEEYNDVLEYLKTSIKKSTLSISACDKIVKRDILISNNIYFNEDQKCMEDIDWSLMLYQYIAQIQVVPEIIYVYRKQRKNSITYSVNSEKINLAMQLIEKWLNFDYNENNELKDLYYNYITYQYLILITNMNKKNSSLGFRKKAYDMRWLLYYDNIFKVKKANEIYKIMGYNIMRLVLKIYMKLNKKGIYKV